MPRTVLDRSDAVLALAGVFRRRGFESGSLSVIQQETGIGRGSLYHFFPDGKADMARAVLMQVRAWFDGQVFEPLRTAADAAQAVTSMSRVVEEYFASRERVCLFAAMTLGEEQETFAAEVHAYFADWVGVLAETLERGGVAKPDAAGLAVDAGQAVTSMSRVVEEYFASRERVCLFAAMTLGEEQETFAAEVRAYFADWVGILAETLERGGVAKLEAAGLALDAVAAIQGGLIMTRALDDDAVFSGIVARANERLLAALG